MGKDNNSIKTKRTKKAFMQNLKDIGESLEAEADKIEYMRKLFDMGKSLESNNLEPTKEKKVEAENKGNLHIIKKLIKEYPNDLARDHMAR